MKAEKRTWYRLALAGSNEPAKLVAAEGDHLGAAVALAEKHVHGAHVIACDVAMDGVPLGESVGKQHIVELGEGTDTESLRWPAGVLPQIGHTAELAGAVKGWARRADNKAFIVEAQTEHDNLVDLFLGLIERVPTADNLEVKVLDHFPAANPDAPKKTDVWLTARVNAKKILAFLDDYDRELIENGHVELGVYVREHKATLRLTEHKTVVWVSETDALASDLGEWLRALDVPQVTQLIRVASVPHFHYRGAKTRDRKKLGDELFKQRLRKVATE
ncbi:MAG TPA: hypothetical protein VGM39_01155 [Kofleriaceae bacterium]